MIRAFQEHRCRPVTDLAGVWQFAFLGALDADACDPLTTPTPDRMTIPGAFDATPAYAGKRGLALYRKKIWLGSTGRHQLILDGLHHWARVFVDGRHVLDHIGGFTRTKIAFDREEAGWVEIDVLTDNRISYELCPLHLSYFDWYHFGGLTRSASIEALGQVWIQQLRIRTLDAKAGTFKVEIDWQAAQPISDSKALQILVEEQLLLDQQVNCEGTAGTFTFDLAVPNPKPWSPASPHLYLLQVRLGDDDLIDRMGLRTVEVRGRDLLLNGEPVRLLGFNRHETHPQFGPGLPETLMLADLQQFRDMGCNFVRGSHYPQDIRFLDLCDEMGIMVWNETIGWQQTAEHLNDPRFIDAQLLQIDEMIETAYNRPSVIMWGLLNESESHVEASRPGYERLMGYFRELDPNRPLTFASNHPFDDLCLDLCDVIAINTYPGWYFHTIDEIPEFLGKIEARLDETGQGGKPLIISEIGAGAIPGWRDWNESRWTEQYQSRLLHTTIDYMFRRSARYTGLAIWLFGDARTGDDKALGRPRQFNNKGVVDEYRRPKQAYFTVKELFSSLT